MPPSFSRDLAAAGRDLAAQRRDEAARARDELAATDGPLSPHERRLAARDREASARDREASAEDRKAAHRDIADEGIDTLTGVLRRGVGLAAIEREIARAERTHEPLVLVFVDTVGLKRTNDTKGHGAGDRMLREVADCLTADLRSYDVVTRIGGDEFVCALSGQTVEQARVRCEQITAGLAERGNGSMVTVGLAAHRTGDSVEALIDRADQAMLAARRG
jgi:diguanylate cyclase (GGDEF)-like protein